MFQPDSVVTKRVEGEGKEKREGVKRRMTEAWGKQFPELCIDFIKASPWEQYKMQRVRYVGEMIRLIVAQFLYYRRNQNYM